MSGGGRSVRTMTTRLAPYLNFPQGNARTALEFYHSVLGGELSINTFGQFGVQGPNADKVMHGQLEADALLLMAADAPADMVTVTPGDNISVAVFGDDVEQMHQWFAALSEGGEVAVPLAVQVWGDEFGSFADQFGINWMFNVVARS